MNQHENLITAIVPVRKEKRRLKNKNTLPFGSSNLLLHKLQQLKKVKRIDQIVVSSEDDEILKTANSVDVITIKRPPEFADQNIPFGYFVEHICNQVSSEHILWACVTAPFIEAEMYEEAIDLYLNKLEDGYDSLISVHKLKRFILDANGSVNFKRGLQHRNSEDLPSLFLYTNGIVLAPREKMIEWKYNWGHVPYMFEVDKKAGLDISDYYDYHIACLLNQEEAT